jgi:DNA-binding transcriptional regulator YiaG
MTERILRSRTNGRILRASGITAYKPREVTKSSHSPEYQIILAKLVEMRKVAGLSQRDLAQRLGREHSFVWRIETGERRLDVLEFHWVCSALEQNSARVYADMARQFGSTAKKG